MKQINIISFGFKYGDQPKANLVFDMRFIRNPYYVDKLRPLSGADKPVADYILGQQKAQSFLVTLRQFLSTALEGYALYGHEHDAITIAFGCTGGQHRSVCFAIEAAALATDICLELSLPATVLVEHRDLRKE